MIYLIYKQEVKGWWEDEEVAGRLQRAAYRAMSPLREKGEEEEGRAIWRCVPDYLCLAGCGHSFVDIRKLKLRKHACCRSFYEVACLTVGLRCIVLLGNLFLADNKWLHSTCYAKPQSRVHLINTMSVHGIIWRRVGDTRINRTSIVALSSYNCCCVDIFRTCLRCLDPVTQFFVSLKKPKFCASMDVYALMFFCDLVTFLIVVFGYDKFGPSVGLLIFYLFHILSTCIAWHSMLLSWPHLPATWPCCHQQCSCSSPSSASSVSEHDSIIYGNTSV